MRKENEYHEIIQHAALVIIKFDLKGNISFFNKHAELVYGYTSDEILGKNIFETLAPHFKRNTGDRNINKKAWIKRILKTIKTEPYGETWNLTRWGKQIYMGWTSSAIKDEQGNVTSILATGIDRTEDKIIYDLLNENQQKFKKLFNSVNDGILVISEHGEILEQNEAILKNFGLTRADMAASKGMKQLFKNIIPNLESILQKVLQHGEFIFEQEFINVKGEKMIVEIRADRIIFEGKKAVLAVGRNIINKKTAQQKISKAAMQAEDKERSRIARELHDSISPILSTIKLYIQSLKDTKDELIINTILLRTEETINESITAISEISNNLSPHVLENFGLIEAVKSFSEKISYSKNIEIKIQSNLKERINPTIENALYRVITELLNNTLKYANATKVFITFIKNDSYLQFKYSDNGIGFEANKIIKNNIGMGLYNITNRIKTIDGTIDIESKKDEGVKVIINIPL